VKQLALVVGGTGGGRPDFAQAGGPDADRLPEALERLDALLEA
jgi:alanyl-tRNA synthetase